LQALHSVCIAEKGGLTINPDFFVDFGAEPDGPVLAHEVSFINNSSQAAIFLGALAHMDGENLFVLSLSQNLDKGRDFDSMQKQPISILLELVFVLRLL
jgi:hypothetical protein